MSLSKEPAETSAIFPCFFFVFWYTVPPFFCKEAPPISVPTWDGIKSLIPFSTSSANFDNWSSKLPSIFFNAALNVDNDSSEPPDIIWEEPFFKDIFVPPIIMSVLGVLLLPSHLSETAADLDIRDSPVNPNPCFDALFNITFPNSNGESNSFKA